MILTRDIKIKINESNFQYFEDMGYENILLGGEIIIPVELLPDNSHRKILCKCDGCGKKKMIMFKNYLKYNNPWGMYYCRKCSEKKRKESLQQSHGCEYPYQDKEIYQKRTDTLIKNKSG